MKRKLFRIIAFILFISIAVKGFFVLTYIFRNSGYDREHIVGIKEEKQPLDVVYIGGSNALAYWQPLRAYHDFGFTSYNYSANSVDGESYKYSMKEVLKTQKPELFILEARGFVNFTAMMGNPATLRNISDSMDITSLSRYALIRDYLSNRIINSDDKKITYYIDLMKYHSNRAIFMKPAYWRFADNRAVCINKGYEWIDIYNEEQREPYNCMTSVSTPIDPLAEKFLYELLEFCKENKLQVLFTASPYITNREDQEQLNYIADIINRYGYSLLNGNLYYKEMNLDFSHDFYNPTHTTVTGAKKYTDFLEKYLMTHFEFEDHRDDPEFAEWNKESERFIREQKDHEKLLERLIKEYHEKKAKEEE